MFEFIGIFIKLLKSVGKNIGNTNQSCLIQEQNIS